MVDVEELLSTGSWTTSTARDQSARGSRASSSNRDADPRPRIPRTLITTVKSNKRYPPPPSVEDEPDSLAREYGSSVFSSDEDPKYIGDVDQNPVIVDVPENNPERRFVLVTQPETHAAEQAKVRKPAAVVNGQRREKSIGPEAGSATSSSSSTAPRDRPRETPKTSPIKERDSIRRDDRDSKDTTKSPDRDLKDRLKERERDRRKSRDVNDFGKEREKQQQEPTIEKKPTPAPAVARKPTVKASTTLPERKPEPVVPEKKHVPRSPEVPAREKERPIPRRAGRARSDYEANTCRRYVLVPSSGDEMKPVSPARQKLKERKSRQDLPRIETKNIDPVPEPRSSRPLQHRRSLSATEIKQGSRDYVEPPQDEEFLSPTVVRKHSTRRRRDEEYYDENRGHDSHRRGKSFHEARSSPLERKDLSRLNREREAQSSSPVTPRRAPSNTKLRRESRRGESPDGHRSSKRGPFRDSGKYRHGSDSDDIPRHPDRTVTIPAYVGAAGAAREVLPKRSRSRRARRESPPSDAVASSSEDDRVPYPQSPPRDPRRSFAEYPDERGFLLMPAPPSDDAPVKSKPLSTLSPPRVSGNNFGDPEQSALRGASTFPGVREPRYSGREKPPSLAGKDTSPPPWRRAEIDEDIYLGDRPKSRGPVPNIMNVSAPLIANPSLEGRPRSPNIEPYRHSAPILNRWQPPKFGGPGSKVLTYRKFLQGVADGSFEALPACPRMKPEAGYNGWLTLPRCNDFAICPSCYEYVFEHTEFGPAFIPMPFRPLNVETACSFGSSYWYQIAWFLTLKYTQPDLRILMSLADIIAGNPPCPGMQLSKQMWYSIRDPFTGKLVPSFSVCGTCIKVVGALLPSLAKSFEPLYLKSKDGYCILRCESTSKDTKFLEYFDAMESVADVSMMNRIPADIQELSDRVQFISTVSKCPQDIQIRDGCWYFMQSVPGLTVCRECFNLVVKPWIEEGNVVASDFFAATNHVPLATCQLYSRRMREVFDKACKRKSIVYLDGKVKERKLMEGDIKTKIRLLVSKPGLAPWEEDELDRLSHEWAEWE